MTIIGEQLTAPEAGWKRYNDTDSRFTYLGDNWNLPQTVPNIPLYQGTLAWTKQDMDGTSVRFRFYGTKIRFVQSVGSSYSNNWSVTIDGIKETVSSYRTDLPDFSRQYLVYEKLDLPLGVHEVLMECGTNGSFRLENDAVDIDETGYLVAQVGQQLTTPESGWKRYDGMNSQITLNGSWSNLATVPQDYNSTILYSTDFNSTASFKFYGTSLRILDAMNTDRDTNIIATIDGVDYNYNAYAGSLVRSSLVFEKTGLPAGIHSVTIKKGTNNAAIVGIDAIDIDETGYLITQVGQQLTAPEAGWQRMDHVDSRFSYSGGEWRLTDAWVSGRFGGSVAAANAIGATVTFKFKGTKLRLIMEYNLQHSGNISVIVDGINKGIVSIKPSTDIVITQTLAYEIANLDDAEHTVQLINNTTDWIVFDAIDIEDTGRLLYPDEVLTPDELGIGKRIRCHYMAASNAVGEYSGLGEETSDFIPVTGEAVPNGDFYFICVGKDHLDRWKLIADRNIQNRISWDVLNSAGIASGSGVPISIEPQTNYRFTTRLLTGGINSTDKNNEWDKYIVESTLGGNITAGDNAVWNWSGIYSCTSTSVSNSSNKSVRGKASANSFYSIATNSIYSDLGFRPVLLIQSLFKSKYLFRDGNRLLAIRENAWVEVGMEPVANYEELLSIEGMKDLSGFTNALIRQLSNPELLFLGTVEDTASIFVSAVPEPQMVLAKDDISLRSIENVDKFTIATDVTGLSNLRLLASPDSGITWYTYNGSWFPIDHTDKLIVAANGMTPVVFNNVPSLAWDELVQNTKKIRFGYYLELGSSTDLCQTDELTGQFDMRGSWFKAKHGVDYDYEYTAEGVFKVYLMNSGDFKINY